MYFAYRSKK
jgi:hypothetical protein